MPVNRSFGNILILSDFDGTFAGRNGRIIGRNLEAISDFKEKGGLFSFSTGRLPSVLERIFPEFREVANAPLIMSNGALLYDPADDRFLRERSFDGRLGREIAKDVLARFPGAGFVVYSDDKTLLDDLMPDNVPGNRWYKMRFNCRIPERALLCRDYIIGQYGDRINCFRSCGHIVEVVDIAADKGSGVEFLRRCCGGERTVCCIGDYENDIDMLRRADLAFCPANAIDEVKRLSVRVLCDHDEGAVAEMIAALSDGLAV